MLNAICSVFLMVLLSCCGAVPETHAPEQMAQPAPVIDSPLGNIFNPVISASNGESGFILLRDGSRALQERLALADAAEHTIEAQYYIWNSDKSGRLLAGKLIEAADRGVSVRVILDDFSIGDRNEQLLAVNSHPDIQIRIYNPFINRSGAAKWLNFAFDFDRLNRRMHNKTFTVDAVAAIVGGRNIGDEYFNQNGYLNFRDLDLFSVGPVVDQVSHSFNLYWNSPWAIPIDLLAAPDPDEEEPHELDALLAAHRSDKDPFLRSEISASPEAHFSSTADELVWAPAEFVYDLPGGNDQEAYAEGPKPVAAHLLQLAAASTKEILVESAYFVLDDKALELAGQLRDQGVSIRALTNSMASNDVLPNHSSYAMVREAMLKSGIELHELRPDAASCFETIGREEFCDGDTFFGLHAKAAVFDRKIVYVGSCNLNLRSAYLNTEVGMFVQSPQLAEMLGSEMETAMTPRDSWRPILRNDNIVWISETDGVEEIVPHEPHTTWAERVKEGILTIVPGAKYY